MPYHFRVRGEDDVVREAIADVEMVDFGTLESGPDMRPDGLQTTRLKSGEPLQWNGDHFVDPTGGKHWLLL